MQPDRRRSGPRRFVVGDKGLVRTVRGENVILLKGTITELKFPVTNLVGVHGQIGFMYVDHLRKSFLDPTENAGIRLPNAGDIFGADPVPGPVD